MEWNNGTIFRVYVSSGSDSVINAKVDISQMQLNNKVYIGVENFILNPDISTIGKEAYWQSNSHIQLQSINLQPYIDYSAYTNPALNTGNSQIFARLPLIAVPTIHSGAGSTYVKFGLDRVLNKNSILYEMINNPNALSNGNLNIRILDQDGNIVPNGYIYNFTFTLVIYKPSNKYN